jgi:hypothetical protein
MDRRSHTTEQSNCVTAHSQKLEDIQAVGSLFTTRCGIQSRSEGKMARFAVAAVLVQSVNLTKCHSPVSWRLALGWTVPLKVFLLHARVES